MQALQSRVDNYIFIKVNKYEIVRPQLQPLRPNGVSSLLFLTYNWRGALSKDSAKFLLAFHILRSSDFKVIATRVLSW